MILTEVRNYIKQAHNVSLQELMWHFKTDEMCMRNFLNHWLRKGCVAQCEKPQSCGKRCNKCNVQLAEHYAWVKETDAERHPQLPYPAPFVAAPFYET